MINNSYSVLTPAGAADVVVTGNVLKITGCPPIDLRYLMNIGAGWKDAVVATPGVWAIVAPAPTAGYTFQYAMMQYVPFTQPAALGNPAVAGINQLRQMNSHTVPSGGETATQMMAAMEETLKRYQNPQVGFLYTEVTSTNTTTITADASAPYLFIDESSIPPAAFTSITNTAEANVAIVSSTNASPIVVTTAADTWVIGQVVNISGHLVNTAANGTWRISATNGTTTITLQGSTGNGVGGATGNAHHVMSMSRGQVNDLIRAGVSSSLLVTGHQYGMIQFNFREVEQADTRQNEIGWTHTLWTDYTANTTNYANFVTALASALGANWIAPAL